MKSAPFLVSTVLASICVILSLASFSGGQSNNTRQAELLRKQNTIQELNQTVNLQNQEFNRQAEIINTGAKVAQQIGPPILREMGYLAAKNKNEKIKNLLVRQKLESFNLTDEALKKEEENRKKPEPTDDSKKKPEKERPAPPPVPASGSTPATSPNLRP